MLLQKIIQQISGMSALAIPAVILYQFAPHLILHPAGMIAYALLVAAWITYFHHKQITNLITALKYAPTGEHKAYFQEQIKACGLDPDTIELRYCYLNDNIASAGLNLIRIDHMLWIGLEDDPDASAAREVIERHVVATIPKEHKRMQDKIKQILTKESQNFIFKHELGHVQSHTSKKIFAGIFTVSFLVALVSLFAAAALLATYGGAIALLGGILIGALLDEIAGYVLNATIKVNEEWNADAFAVKHSTKEEVQAAADFFEQYEKEAQEVRAITFGVLNYLPTTALTAHPEGKKRVAYLKEAAQKKKSKARNQKTKEGQKIDEKQV